MKSVSKNHIIKELSICGQIAEHKSAKMQEHNIDEEMLLKTLTDDEKQTLMDILTKLKKQWIADHAEHHKNKNTNK